MHPSSDRRARSVAEVAAEPLPEEWCGRHSRPLVLDIGCHRGHFLIQMALDNPGIHFLGVEKQAVRVERTRKKVARLALSNVLVWQADGLAALRDLPTGCVSGIHVLFPDPWPKRRHGPRRLVTKAFFGACLRVLRQGGLLRIVTDDPAYAEQIRTLAMGFDGLIPHLGEVPSFPPTAFELKFLAEGRPVNSMIWLLDIDSHVT